MRKKRDVILIWICNRLPTHEFSRKDLLWTEKREKPVAREP